MNYHPDDQDEIDRLHAEFIAVDEPYNEQVMAFQDASYVLGLKRGQGELAWEYSRAEDWCRAANKYSNSMCALGELLGVPEDDQSTGAVLDAVRGLKASEAALQQRLNEVNQRIDELMQDKHRLDALAGNFWDVRHHSTALADTGDYTSCVEIVGRWMDKPHERVIGENYNENLRAAIDQAMAADAYPPARPEYPELDAALDQLAEDSPEVGS